MNTNTSYESRYHMYLFILEGCIKTIEKKYQSNDVSDIKSYQVIILKRIYKSLSTIRFVLSKECDPISAYGMLRIIIDSICAYCFIYENDDWEEVKFRHYLYLLDGCLQYNKLIDDIDNKNGRTNMEEEKSKHNMCNMKSIQDGIEKALQIHNYSRIDEKQVENIIKSANWKYKEMGGIDKNKYKWEDLYENIGCDREYAKFISQFLSQYVHGLFLCNTLNPQAETHYRLIYCTLTTFSQRIIISIKKNFGEDVLRCAVSEIDCQEMLNSGIDFCYVNELYGRT